MARGRGWLRPNGREERGGSEWSEREMKKNNYIGLVLSPRLVSGIGKRQDYPLARLRTKCMQGYTSKWVGQMELVGYESTVIPLTLIMKKMHARIY